MSVARLALIPPLPLTMAAQAGPLGPGGLLAVPGLGWEDVDSDEEVVGIRPKSSPRPRRRSSASEDDFDPPPSGSRRVSFADAKGLSLVRVKEFALWDVPHLPDPSEGQDPEEYFLTPLTFSLRPPEELLARVQEQKVELETLEILPGTTILRGVVCVLNVSFTKAVYVRTSLDCWSSHFDLLTDYLPGSSEGQVDRFAFKLTLVPPFVDHRAQVDFCLRYETPVGTFWANNESRNFSLFCERRVRDQRPQREKKSCLKSSSQNVASTEYVYGPEPSSQELSSKDVLNLDKVESIAECDRKPSCPGEEAQKSQADSRRNSRQRSRRKARMARVRDHFARRAEGDRIAAETSGQEPNAEERLHQSSNGDLDSTTPDQPIMDSVDGVEGPDRNAGGSSSVAFGTVVAPLYPQVIAKIDGSRRSVTKPSNHYLGIPIKSSPPQGDQMDASDPDRHPSMDLMVETDDGPVHGEDVVKSRSELGAQNALMEDTSRINDSVKTRTEESMSRDFTEDSPQPESVEQVSCPNSSPEQETFETSEVITYGLTTLDESGLDYPSEKRPVDGGMDIQTDIQVEDEAPRHQEEGRWIQTRDTDVHQAEIISNAAAKTEVPEEGWKNSIEIEAWEEMLQEEEEKQDVFIAEESEEIKGVEHLPVNTGLMEEGEDLMMEKDSEKKKLVGAGGTWTDEKNHSEMVKIDIKSEEQDLFVKLNEEMTDGNNSKLLRNGAIVAGNDHMEVKIGNPEGAIEVRDSLENSREKMSAKITPNLLEPLGQNMAETLEDFVKDEDDKMSEVSVERADLGIKNADEKEKEKESGMVEKHKQEFDEDKSSQNTALHAENLEADLLVTNTTGRIHNVVLEERNLVQEALKKQTPQVKVRKTKQKKTTEDEEPSLPTPTTEQVDKGEPNFNLVKTNSHQEETPRIKTRKSKTGSRMDTRLEIGLIPLESDTQLKESLDSQREEIPKPDEVISSTSTDGEMKISEEEGATHNVEMKEPIVTIEHEPEKSSQEKTSKETPTIKSRKTKAIGKVDPIQNEGVDDMSASEGNLVKDIKDGSVRNGSTRTTMETRNQTSADENPTDVGAVDEPGEETRKDSSGSPVLTDPQETETGTGEKDKKDRDNVEDRIIEAILDVKENKDLRATFDETPRVKARRTKTSNTEASPEDKVVKLENHALEEPRVTDNMVDEGIHFNDTQYKQQGKVETWEDGLKATDDEIKSVINRKGEMKETQTPRTKTRRNRKGKKTDKCSGMDPGNQTTDDPGPRSETLNVRITDSPIFVPQEEIKTEDKELEGEKDKTKAKLVKNSEKEVVHGETLEEVEVKPDKGIKEVIPVHDKNSQKDQIKSQTGENAEETPRIKARRSKLAKKRDSNQKSEPGIQRKEEQDDNMVHEKERQVVDPEEILKETPRTNTRRTKIFNNVDASSAEETHELRHDKAIVEKNPEKNLMMTTDQLRGEGACDMTSEGMMGNQSITMTEEIPEVQISRTDPEEPLVAVHDDDKRESLAEEDKLDQSRVSSEDITKKTTQKKNPEVEQKNKYLERVVKAEEDQAEATLIQNEIRADGDQPQDSQCWKSEQTLEKIDLNFEKVSRLQSRKMNEFRSTDQNDVLRGMKENKALLESGVRKEERKEATEKTLENEKGNTQSESTAVKQKVVNAESSNVTEREEKHTILDAKLDFVATQTLQRDVAGMQEKVRDEPGVDVWQEQRNVEKPRVKSRRSKVVNKMDDEVEVEIENVHQVLEGKAGEPETVPLENTEDDHVLEEKSWQVDLGELEEHLTRTPEVHQVSGGSENDEQECKVQRSTVEFMREELDGSPAPLTDDEWVESDDPEGNSTESDSDDEVELYMHCLRVAHTGAVRDTGRDPGLAKRRSVCRNMVTSMPIISESMDEELNLVGPQDPLDGPSTAEEPPEVVNGWRETLSCRYISRTLLCATLLGVFVAVAQRYDFLACLGLYLASLVWLLCRREKPEKEDRV